MTAGHPDNLTYQPKLSPKWIGEDGQDMVLIWSDAMKDDQGKSHMVNYRWNQMEIRLERPWSPESRKSRDHLVLPGSRRPVATETCSVRS